MFGWAITFFTACFEGIKHKNMWWPEKVVNMFKGASFRTGRFISGRRFKRIAVTMRYTTVDVPPFLDWFHDVRHTIDSFNKHYELDYIPTWLSCLDESMNSFLDNYFPSVMCVPHKSHPFGK
jgi:hypothetical protein